MKKRLFIILSFALIFSLMPFHVNAEEQDPNYVYEAECTVVLPMAGETPNDTVTYPENTRYTVTSFGGWKVGEAANYDATYGETPDGFVYGETYSFRIMISGTDSYSNRVAYGTTKVTVNGNTNVQFDSYGGNQFSVVVEFVAGCPHETETVDAVEPTYFEKGYTGDQYCSICDAIVSRGEAIDMLEVAHRGTVDNSNASWVITNEGDLIVHGSGQLYDHPWSDNITKIKKVIIEEGITELPNNAFKDGISIASVQLPDSLCNLGDGTFSGCTDLININIPNNIAVIPEAAFKDCLSLRQIELPSSLKKINTSAFTGCRLLSSIDIPDSVTEIGNYAFENCVKLNAVRIPSGITELKDSTFEGCKSIEAITIPNNVKVIKGAFKNCSGLNSITFGSGIELIGENAFYNCTSLESVALPSSVKTLGSSCFGGCEKLSSVTLPGSLQDIGSSAFNGCVALSEITIPTSVVRIRSYSFDDSLKVIYYLGALEDWLEIDIYDNNTSIENATKHYAICNHELEDEYTIDKPATCTKEGSKSKHCKKCGELFNVMAIEPLGHSWGSPSYTWSSDYSNVVAKRVCKNDKSHVDAETAKTTSKVIKAATYTTKGETTYTAVFSNSAFSTQTKTVANIAKLSKKANTLTAKGKTVTVKYAKVKKKAQTILAKNAFTIRKPQGKVTYKKVSGNKKIFVSSAGKVTVKKGLKKGKYKVKVNVKAAGTTTYNAGTKTTILTITVK